MSDLFESTAPAPLYEDLVGEGKKFKDNAAVVNKIVHADKHISTLEAELAQARADLQARSTLEELTERLAKNQNSEVPNRELPDTNRPDAVKTDDIEAKIAAALKADRDKTNRDSNITKVRDGLKERFGPDYNNELPAIAAELGVGTDFLNNIAGTSPSAFLKLVDSVKKPDRKGITPPPASRDLGTQPGSGGIKNAAYYRELRKTDPMAYNSRRVQSEMHRQAMELGSDFYS